MQSRKITKIACHKTIIKVKWPCNCTSGNVKSFQKVENALVGKQVRSTFSSAVKKCVAQS
jgi:hypothetical protein